MSAENPTTNPETDKAISDNDRKFVVESIDPEFLTARGAESYYMITDWLETNDNDEAKLVRKVYDESEKLLHIAKVGVDQDRKSQKTPLGESKYAEYAQSLDPSKPHVEKRRYEFEFTQNGVEFTAKYDVFADSNLRVLEIDAKSKDEKDREKFDPSTFDFALVEVTGIEQFYGHRVAGLIPDPKTEQS